MAERGELLTVGHSTHEEGRFLELLRGAAVKALADVRAMPRSRRNPQFNAAALAVALEEAGIAYVELGENLGGHRAPADDSPNTAWENDAFRGYADHMATAEFAAGVAVLEQLAAEQRTAVMCAEGDWQRCHRRLVSDALTTRGWRVVHLGPDASLTPHVLDSRAVVEADLITYPVPAPPGQTSLSV